MELDFRKTMMDFTYTNRDGQPVVFSILDDNKTCTVSTEGCSYIRTGEAELTEMEKKNDPHRIKEIIWVDLPAGPLIAMGLDLNNWLYKKKDFLEQDHKKIITYLDYKDRLITIEYKKDLIKSHPNNAKKVPIKEAKPTNS